MALVGKTSIVTGSANGIGRMTALRLAREGSRLILVDIDRERLRGLEAEARGLGAEAIAVAADLAKRRDVDRLVAQSIERFGRIDILVNNVGGSRGPRRLEEIAEVDFYEVIDLNLKTTFLCTQAVVPHMIRQQGGRIVNLSSMAAHCGSPVGSPLYAAAKAAVLGLTRHLAGELAPMGITVNAVAPGVTLSERMSSRLSDWTAEARDNLLQRIPLRRLGSVEDAAAAIVFLCSDDASYITGATIDVNGGLYFH